MERSEGNILSHDFYDLCSVSDIDKLMIFIRTFRSEFPAQVALLSLITALLWGHAFISPPPVNLLAATSSQQFLLLPFASYPLLGVTVSSVLVIAQALIFNQFLISSDFISRNTLFPAFLFILFFSHAPSLLQVSAMTFITPLMLIILTQMIRLSKKEGGYPIVFFSSILVIITSLIYPVAIFFIVFIWFSFAVNGIWTWREWLLSILGPFVIGLYILTYGLWQGNLYEIVNGFKLVYEPPLTLDLIPSIPEIVIVIVALFIAVQSLRSGLVNRMEKVLSYRKNVWTFVWFTLIALAGSMFAGSLVREHLALVTLPIIALSSSYLLTMKRRVTYEVLISLMLIMAILQNMAVL